MSSGRRRTGGEHTRERRIGPLRPLSFVLLLLFGLARVPVASAHGGPATTGVPSWLGIAVVLGGIAFLGGAILLKRTNRISPTVALYGVLFGLAVAAIGTVLFDGLQPDHTYTASSMPFPRSWYAPLALSVGLLISVLSFVVGWLRWPTRPRYTFLGILLGAWIAYPYLVPGPAGVTSPLGYAIVLSTPALVGYIVWKDAGSVLRAVLRDPVSRRFGAGVGLVVALFFASLSGYLSVFLEVGSPGEMTVAVLPVVYQLVTWPTVEVVLPHVPLFVAISPGLLVLVGSLSLLTGLYAALVARHWRVGERAGMTESTAGTAAVLGSCTCGCCGPLAAKVAILAASPSLAAPLYWVFVDSASPLTSLFIVGSIVLFTASLVRSVESAPRPGRPASIAPAD